MTISYFNENREPFGRVIVVDVERVNVSKYGLSYWIGVHMFYLPFYRVGDVRIYENKQNE